MVGYTKYDKRYREDSPKKEQSLGKTIEAIDKGKGTNNVEDEGCNGKHHYIASIIIIGGTQGKENCLKVE